MSYYVYRLEGGLKFKREGPFVDKNKAEKVCEDLNEKHSIPLGGFEVHEDD